MRPPMSSARFSSGIFSQSSMVAGRSEIGRRATALIRPDGPRCGARCAFAEVRDGLVWAESMLAIARSIHDARPWVLLLIRVKFLDAEQKFPKARAQYRET